MKGYDPAEDPDKDFNIPFLQLVNDTEKMDNPLYRLMKAGANLFKVNKSSSSLRKFEII